MFIRRIPGPVSVTLPDGSCMTRADLPPPDTTRWVARREAAVVHAVEFGLIPAAEARARYGLSEEELDSWRAAHAKHGLEALKATATQRFPG